MIRKGDKTNKVRHHIILITLLLGVIFLRDTVNRGLSETSTGIVISDSSNASKQGVIYLTTPVLLEMPIEELLEVNIDL